MNINIVVKHLEHEKFVKDILQPFFKDKTLNPRKLLGKEVNYQDFIKQCKINSKTSDKAISMFNYGDIPIQWWQYTQINNNLAELENRIKQDVGNNNFETVFIMHEFEIIFFCNSKMTADSLNNTNIINEIDSILKEFNNDIESINTNFSPYERIKTFYPNYQKTIDGIRICKNLGLNNIISKSNSFNKLVSLL